MWKVVSDAQFVAVKFQSMHPQKFSFFDCYFWNAWESRAADLDVRYLSWIYTGWRPDGDNVATLAYRSYSSVLHWLIETVATRSGMCKAGSVGWLPCRELGVFGYSVTPKEDLKAGVCGFYYRQAVDNFANE
jgi:hypothetical protein